MLRPAAFSVALVAAVAPGAGTGMLLPFATLPLWRQVMGRY